MAYNGDPESSQLSDGERRIIKRRIANRESARRVRQKREVQMKELLRNVGSWEFSERVAIMPACPIVQLTASHLLYPFSTCCSQSTGTVGMHKSAYSMVRRALHAA